MLVRVIDYTIDDGRENPASYRLFTTLPDPTEATAVDLAAAYTQRWEIELAFDELKTHQRGPRTVLRSKSPDLVLQEIWGHLCCHYAIRSLMAEAATHFGHDPDRVSFVAALRITRQSIAHQGDFPPSRPQPRPPRLADLPAPAQPTAQPRPTTTRQPPSHQTQDTQMARQTRSPRRLAPTAGPTRLPHPDA